MSLSPDLFLAGRWTPGEGEPLRSQNPATGETVYDGRAATPAQTDAAIGAARAAFEPWADRTFDERAAVITRFAEELKREREALAGTISRETGKPRWEARTEVDAMVGKVPLSIAACRERTGEETRRPAPEAESVVRHRPHGVVGVLGPFNFPGHLPNGHLVPALLAGNTAVFKPSEYTPAVAAHTAACWEAVGLPPGVLNLVQGGVGTARALAAHDGLDGLFFTGSANVGRALHRAFADRPDKILALEMGGNNPLVVVEPADVPAAVYCTILSAFLSAGQRCTAARRLVLVDGPRADGFLSALATAIPAIRIGASTDEPEPFMGPLIHREAARGVLAAQAGLLAAGARPLVAVQETAAGLPFLSPGLLDVTGVKGRPDEEVFGPLLQVIRVPSFDAALEEANATRFGLAAGLLGGDAPLFRRFARRVRAGVVNWNRPTTGASSAAPFGGVGHSGNGRPSAFYAADYCAFPVASLEADAPRLPANPLPGLRLP